MYVCERHNLVLSDGLNVLHELLDLIVEPLLGLLLELVELGLVVDVLGPDGAPDGRSANIVDWS